MHSQAYSLDFACSVCTHRPFADPDPFRCRIPGVKRLHVQLASHRQLHSDPASKTSQRRVRTGSLTNRQCKAVLADHFRVRYAADTSQGVYQTVNEPQQMLMHHDCAIDISLDTSIISMMVLQNT